MTLDRTEIFDKVCDIAADVLGVESDDLSEATTFDDLDANSLDRLQLVTAMEDEFDIEIDDDKLMAINSVAEAVDAIEQTLEA
ncbi:phosphopantetheine-binding protein [Collinsella stercoris]|uniref:phosphopantetheine-binding protein n=1 Tax=Collinsella stercoris TaxID=147206 RepID=UPI003A8F145C